MVYHNTHLTHTHTSTIDHNSVEAEDEARGMKRRNGASVQTQPQSAGPTHPTHPPTRFCQGTRCLLPFLFISLLTDVSAW